MAKHQATGVSKPIDVFVGKDETVSPGLCKAVAAK